MLTFADPQTSFIANSPEVNSQTEADYLLSDELHRAKNIKTSNLKALLNAFSLELTRVEEKLQELVDEFYPPDTTNLIVEWERTLGIPDDCFKVEGVDLEMRRKQVVAKLALMNLTTTQDFIDLAAFFDVAVTITSGSEIESVFPLTFPTQFFLNEKGAKFTMVVTFVNIEQPNNIFPLTFPFIFDVQTPVDLIICLFNKLKPAPVRVVARFKP